MGPALTFRRSCRCWPPGWGTCRSCRPIITFTLSRASDPRPIAGLTGPTVTWSFRSPSRKEEIDDHLTESPRFLLEGLLHGSPAQASRNEPSHCSELSRQLGLAASLRGLEWEASGLRSGPR